MSLADPVFLACALAVMVGALIQSTGGIGFAMFAAPIVAILRPDMVPGPMILAGGLVSLLIAAREFRNIDYRGAAIAIGGRIPGSIVAGLIIGLLPRTTFAISFAVLILIAVALSVSGWRVRATPLSLAAAGFGSGVMGTITSVGAPPMGIVMQNMDPPTLRATIGARAVLLTGDAEREWEALLATRPIRSDVLKVAHHGSRTSSTPPLLDAVRPRLAVISCGRHNLFGHPHAEVLLALRRRGVFTRRTDIDGTVDVLFHGDHLLVHREIDTPP